MKTTVLCFSSTVQQELRLEESCIYVWRVGPYGCTTEPEREDWGEEEREWELPK